jgi:transcriptional regulator with XRE-family HTH domain
VKAEAIAQFDGVALGARIKLLRELHGMSLQQVANAAGYTKPYIWAVESGKSVNPSVHFVWGLANALSVSPEMLLGLDDKMPNVSAFAIKIAGMVDREIKRAILAGETK